MDILVHVYDLQKTGCASAYTAHQFHAPASAAHVIYVYPRTSEEMDGTIKIGNFHLEAT